VLGLLLDGRAQHGYALVKAYRERVGSRVGTGNFYRELQRLVADGLILTVARPADDDPRRAPYAITPAGAEEFEAWFRSPANGLVPTYEDELAARIMFLAEMKPEVAAEALGQWQEELWLQAKVLERERDTALMLAERAGAATFPVRYVLLDRRSRRLASDLGALEDIRARYQSWLDAQAKSAQLGVAPADESQQRPPRRVRVVGKTTER